MRHIVISFLLFATLSLPAVNSLAGSDSLCAYNESQFLNFVGGASVGTALTSSLAGESIVLIVTKTGLLYATAPAVAPTVTLAAGGAAAAYATLKAYCSRHDATDKFMTWYQASVQNTSNGMEIAVNEHGKLVDYTSRVFEGVADSGRSLTERATDWMCRVSGNC